MKNKPCRCHCHKTNPICNEDKECCRIWKNKGVYTPPKELCCGGGCGNINCSHCQTVKKSKNEPFKGKNWRLGYMAGIKEERKAFTMGLRCMHCGEPKEDNPLSDMCHSCFESA